jgi:hypothetical protein
MGVNWMGKHPNAGWNGPWTVNGHLAATTLSTSGAATLASAAITGALSAAGVSTSGYFKVGNTASKTGTAPVLTANDVVMLFDGATQASVLPSATAMSGYVIFLKNIGTGTATITGSATETIDGGAGTVALTPMKGVTLYSNGTSWYKLASI